MHYRLALNLWEGHPKISRIKPANRSKKIMTWYWNQLKAIIIIPYWIIFIIHSHSYFLLPLSFCSFFKEFRIYFVYLILLPSSVSFSFSFIASVSVINCSSPFLLLNLIYFVSVFRRIWLWSKKSTWNSLLLNLNMIACFVLSHCLTKTKEFSLQMFSLSENFLGSYFKWVWNLWRSIFFLLKLWSFGRSYSLNVLKTSFWEGLSK